MVTDRFTAKILGGVVIVMTVLIDVSCFFYAKPEVSHRPTFPLFLLVLSLPMIGAAVYFFRRARSLPE